MTSVLSLTASKYAKQLISKTDQKRKTHAFLPGFQTAMYCCQVIQTKHTLPLDPWVGIFDLYSSQGIWFFLLPGADTKSPFGDQT